MAQADPAGPGLRPPPGDGLRGEHRGPGVAADLRPRARRPSRHCGRRPLVHDHLRAGLADHLVDGAPARPVAGTRHHADARQPAGNQGRPGDRGGTWQDPARDAVRHAGLAVAGRQQRLLRHRRRHPAVRDAAWRNAPLGPGAPRRRRTAPARRPGARLDRQLRGPRRRRVRRVRQVDRTRPGQPGLEGLIRRHHVRRRHDGRPTDCPRRGSGLRLRRLPGQVALLHRTRGHRRRGLLGAEGARTQGAV